MPPRLWCFCLLPSKCLYELTESIVTLLFFFQLVYNVNVLPKTSFIVEFFPTDYWEKLIKSQRSKGIPRYFHSDQSVPEARFEQSNKKNRIQHLILSLPRRLSYNSASIHRTVDSTLLICQVSLVASLLEVNLITRVFSSSHSGTGTLDCLIFLGKQILFPLGVC